MDVADEVIRARLPGFDGLERAFVVAPRLDGATGEVSWSWAPLEYGQTQLSSGLPIEAHHLGRAIGGEKELSVLRRLGIAVGLETNVGRVWLQPYGNNYSPRG